MKENCKVLRELAIVNTNITLTVEAHMDDTVVLPCHYCGFFMLSQFQWMRVDV